MAATSSLSSSSNNFLALIKGYNSLEKEICRIKCVSDHHFTTTEPAFSPSFPFPESLLQPEEGKLLQDYIHGPLDPSHPLFIRLNEKLTLLNPSDNQDPVLKKIQSAYQNYLQTLCTAEGKRRWKLIKGNVWLNTHIQNRLFSIEISQKLGRKIASLNSQNTTIKNNAFGDGAVTQIGKIFFKRALRNKINPEIVHAMYNFSMLLLGKDTPPSHLIKLDNIVVKELSQGTDQIKRVSHLILASKEVAGVSLWKYIDCLQSVSDYRQFIEQISLPSFSKGFLFDLIFLPYDGKCDNFQITRKLIEGKNGIRAIDYDSFTTDPIQNGVVKCRTIRFIFDPLMSQPVHPSYRESIANLNIENFLIEWVASIAEYNELLSRMKKNHLLNKQDLEQLSIPMTLSPGNLTFFYDTLVEMQRLFRTPITFTHWELLKHFQPTLYRVYQAYVKRYPDNPTRFQNIFFPLPPSLMKLKNTFSGFLNDLEVPPPSPPLPIDEQPFNALITFLKSIFPKITAEKQDEILSKIALRFPLATQIELSYLKISCSRLSKFVNGLTNLKELTLNASEFNSYVGFRTLISSNPDLALTISEDCHFPLNEIRKLYSYARRHNRQLIYKVEDKNYFISKSGTDSPTKCLYHEAACNGHVSMIPLLLELGINPIEFDENGNSPLHIAIYPNPFYEFVETYLKSIPDDHIRDICNHKNIHGNTPLHLSVWQQDSRIVDLLIKEGSVIDTVSQLGYTALHWAEKFELNESALLLIGAGANTHIKTSDSEIPLSLALENEEKPSQLNFEAEEEKLAFLKDKYGDQPHPDIANTLINLGKSCWVSDDNARAIDYCLAALTMLNRFYGGAPNLFVVNCLYILGVSYKDLGDHQSAIEVLKGTLNIISLITKKRPTILLINTLSALGLTYCNTKEYVKAIETFNLCLSLEFPILYPIVLKKLAGAGHNLGFAWDRLGNAQKAISCYLDTLEKFNMLSPDDLGLDHVDTLHNLAGKYYDLQDYQSAIDYLNLILNLQKKFKDTPMDSIGFTLKDLGDAYTCMILQNGIKNIQEALKYYQEAYEIFIKTYGEDDFNTRQVKGAIENAKNLLETQKPLAPKKPRVPAKHHNSR